MEKKFNIVVGEDGTVKLPDAVLEKLGDDKAVLAKARLLMGAKTLEYSRQVEAFLGRE